MLYHYNVRKFDELLTKELQGTLSKEEKEKEASWSKFKEMPGPYYESLSFLLEPAPVEYIGSSFHKHHHTWAKGNKLIEHEIDLDDIDLYGWVIAEAPVTMFFVDNIPMSDLTIYKKIYFKSVALGRKLFNEMGDDVKSLKKALKNIPPGTTEEAFSKFPKYKNYEEIKDTYAATVPHLIVYTKKAIPVHKTKKVTIDDKPFPNQPNPVLESLPITFKW